MKNIKLWFLLVMCLCALPGVAQNWTVITANNLVWTDGNKVTGTICFVATDISDTIINFRVGGGGQVVSKPACANVVNGVIQGIFQVPNPNTTAPRNIRYRITVTDASGNTLKYTKVTFSGTSFNFDNYVPTTTNLPPVGASVAVLGVQKLSVLESCDGCGSLNGFHSFYSFNLTSPAVTDSGLFQTENDSFHYKIVGVSCTTDQGGATINLEVRNSANANGTPVLSSSLSCSGTLNSAGDITPVTVPVGNSVALVISSVSGTPGILRVNVTTQF